MRQRPDAAPSLAVGERRRAPGQINFGPPQTESFTAAPAGQRQEPRNGDCRRPDSGSLGLAERLAECRVFVIAQPPLTLSIGEADHAMNRIVRPQSAAHRVGEYRAEQAYRSGRRAAAAADSRKSA